VSAVRPHTPDDARLRTLVQVSDLHLTARPGPADRALAAAVAMLLAASDVAVDAVLLTGDLSEDGSAASYRRLAAAVAPLRSTDAELLVLPGNHDDVATLRTELLDGGPVDRVVALAGVRIVCLDSTVPGAHHGALWGAQLEWLGGVLAADPHPGGTVLALHHPPLAFADPVLDRLALRESDLLATVLEGTDVGLVVCGHAHQPTAGMLAGVPVWCAPALTMGTDALPPAGRARSLDGHGGLTRITLRGASSTCTLVPLIEHAVLRYDEARADRISMLDRLEADAPEPGEPRRGRTPAPAPDRDDPLPALPAAEAAR
jgi:3',5'-cyclic AMP phosphodiesterase CpdA